MLDSLAHFCLKFGHITVILPCVMLGIIFHKRDIYAKAACFLLYVMIFNTLLKILFKVPLFPHLGNGYAFPSGHMHAASVFYGYILYKTKYQSVKYILSAVICCLGFSLIYCNFHDLLDVVGAVGFAVAEIFAYHIIYQKFGESGTAFFSIISAIIIMFVLQIIHKIEPHVWLAFYGLIGTEFSLMFFEDKKIKQISTKIVVSILSTLIIVALYYLFKFLDGNPAYITYIKFALIPIIIISCTNIAASRRIL